MAAQVDGGATALVTGANSGIGKDVARQLALTGRYRTVLMGCRDPARGAAAKAELEQATGRRVFEVVRLNLSDAAEVRAAAASLPGAIDDLVMNAGGFGGPEPFAATCDGVASIVAANVFGHAILLDALIGSRLLKRSAVLAGSEAARGVPAMGIKRPVIEDGSTEAFARLCDGSTFLSSKTAPAAAYAWTKLIGALWMNALARAHPDLKLLTMSPGGTANTSVMDFMPQPGRFIIGKILVPRVFPLFGMAHAVDVGARRLVEAVLDDRFRSGVFYASRTKVTGPVVDQATLFPTLGDPVVQDNTAAAVRRFVERATASEAPYQSRRA